MPVALVAPERASPSPPVCSARTLAEGRPPLGIACAQQDVAHVYPLRRRPRGAASTTSGAAPPTTPARTAERLEHQEASVQRFLELSGEDYPRGRLTACRGARRLRWSSPPASLFLAVCVVLARWLTTDARERDAVHALLAAQARGDATAMLDRLDGCADARLRRHAAPRTPGGSAPRRGRDRPLDSDTAYAAGRADGPTRVVWRSAGLRPATVQCVDVERDRDRAGGPHVTLLPPERSDRPASRRAERAADPQPADVHRVLSPRA